MSQYHRNNPEEPVRHDWFAGAKRVTPFVAHTGLMGSTEPGQQVTADNIHLLPPGSVVKNQDGSRIIHLHDDLWLWIDTNAWLYDNVEHMKSRLDNATVCHLP